jgi:hypothetical protein
MILSRKVGIMPLPISGSCNHSCCNETKCNVTKRIAHAAVSRLSAASGREFRWIFKETVMKKLILASLSAIALFGIAACSDNGPGTDKTTTQSTTPPATEPAPAQPGQDNNAMKPATPPATNPAPQQ